MKKRVLFLSLSWMLLSLASSRADRVITLEGDLLEGEVQGITASQELLFTGQDPWPLKKLRAIVPATQAQDVAPGQFTVWLTNGSRFSTSKLKLAEETYHLDNPVLGALEVPIDLVWAVRLGQPDPNTRFADTVRTMDDLKEDIIYVTGTGTTEMQEVHGLIEELDQDGLTFDQAGELKVLPADQVHAVILASPWFQPESSSWIISRLTLSDGSLISGHVRQMEDSRIRVDLGQGVSIELPWSEVRRMTIESDLLHYLSDLQPTESTTEAIYAYPRTWKRDLNVRGQALRLGQDRFEKGLGVASGTVITFANDGDYTLFTATIGLDSQSGSRGDCEFVIKAGKEEVFRRRFRSGDAPEFFKLDVGDHRKITLAVEPGILGLDLNDDANWGEACFLELDER